MINVVNNLFCAGLHVQTMDRKEGRVFQKGRKRYLNEETPALGLQVTGSHCACKHQDRLIVESSLQIPPELWKNCIPWEMLRAWNVSSWSEKGWCLGMLVLKESMWPPCWGEEGEERIFDLNWKDFFSWF